MKIIFLIFINVLIFDISSNKNLKEENSLIYLEEKKINSTKLPIIVFHGFNGSCEGDNSTTNYLRNKSKAYTKCLETGEGFNSVFKSIYKQVKLACDEINKDPNLQGDLIIVGFSQGGIIGRFVTEKCKMKGKVKRLITLGTPHMGVERIPRCPENLKLLCNLGEFIIEYIVYIPGIYHIFSPFSFARSPPTENLYRKYNYFLADLNNEKFENENEEENKRKFMQLDKLVLIKFNKDDMVYPKESAWFSKYDKNWELENLEDSQFYKEDYLGLREMNEKGKVEFFSFKGKHMELTNEELDKYVIPSILS